MALNFSRCVAIFGSSWSEGRPSNTTFSPSPLAGCSVALEEVGEPAADTELPEPTRADGPVSPWRTAPQGHRCRGCQGRRRATQLEQREGKLPASSRCAISRNGVSRDRSGCWTEGRSRQETFWRFRGYKRKFQEDT